MKDRGTVRAVKHRPMTVSTVARTAMSAKPISATGCIMSFVRGVCPWFLHETRVSMQWAETECDEGIAIFLISGGLCRLYSVF